LQVNRGAVREALKRLSQMGLIATQHGEGTRVLDFRESSSLELLPRLLFKSGGEIDLAVVRSLMELRAAMAPDIARLCARRASPEIAAGLAEVARRMERHEGELTTLQALALEFWDVLVRGADNIAYRLAFNSLRVAYDGFQEELAEVLRGELEDVPSYRAIAVAVADVDEARARQIAGELIARGTGALLEAIAALESDGA
ncbi:MAG: FadR family transcriptional regulator, partial [Myxococcales bacterium]|nr:FadR family transcriptional regulator [Myxococcales bacterium]